MYRESTIRKNKRCIHGVKSTGRWPYWFLMPVFWPESDMKKTNADGKPTVDILSLGSSPITKGYIALNGNHIIARLNWTVSWVFLFDYSTGHLNRGLLFRHKQPMFAIRRWKGKELASFMCKDFFKHFCNSDTIS